MSQIEFCPITPEWHSPQTQSVTYIASLFEWMHRKLKLEHVHLTGTFCVADGVSWSATDQRMLETWNEGDGNCEAFFREHVENYIVHKGPSPFHDPRYIAGETVDDSWKRVMPGVRW